jgi:hypothetical protein
MKSNNVACKRLTLVRLKDKTFKKIIHENENQKRTEWSYIHKTKQTLSEKSLIRDKVVQYIITNGPIH